jgi:hypothetical protein
MIHGCILGSIITRKAGAKATLYDKYSLTTPKIIERIGECLIWIFNIYIILWKVMMIW